MHAKAVQVINYAVLHITLYNGPRKSGIMALSARLEIHNTFYLFTDN